jgi:DNA end-binding protein Ku
MEPRGKGLMGTLLRYPYEVRDEKEYFDDIPNIKVKKDMLDLAQHIVETKSGHFEPESFEDHYEAALRELIEKKSKGIKIEAPKRGEPAKVINLMDALRKSIRTEQAGGKKQAKAKRGKKRVEGQREMLFSIPGKKPAKDVARQAPRKSARAGGRRKAG